jgi:3-phosphoshikimate 1-carboxyvinyltransferase
MSPSSQQQRRDEIVRPARRLRGALTLPGDKSISHRYAMLAAIAEGPSRIVNYSTGADCHSTLSCLQALGTAVRWEDRTLVIEGRGLEGWREPAQILDAGNSGSTIRMLAGLLAGQRFLSRITGDASLCRRPMDRIMKPLERMGARIQAREGRYPPLQIEGAPLNPIQYELPVPSAQVKTCVLFAGLYAEGVTTVLEPVPTRDHTEIALRQFGAELTKTGRTIQLQGRPALKAQSLSVPGDLSSAAFFLAAGLLVPDSEILLQGVGLNPTRSALLDFLVSMGADLRLDSVEQRHGELVGNLLVRASTLRGGVIEGALTAALIDEIPVLAVLGAAGEEGIRVRDAAELRVKETDRIATIADNLRRMGIQVEVFDDGFFVPGRQRFHAAELDSFGDHRIAMAFAVAALRADGECKIRDAAAACVSFPEFFERLNELRAG